MSLGSRLKDIARTSTAVCVKPCKKTTYINIIVELMTDAASCGCKSIKIEKGDLIDLILYYNQDVVDHMRKQEVYVDYDGTREEWTLSWS